MKITNKFTQEIVSWRNEITKNLGDNPTVEGLRDLGKGFFGYRKFVKSAGDGFDGVQFNGVIGNGVVYNGDGGGFIIHQKGNGEIYIKALLTWDSTNEVWTRLNPSTYQSLDTPYYTYKMQQEGIFDDYIVYRDELHIYEQEQKLIGQQRQEAYQQALKENPKLTYEEWLSTQPMQMFIQVEPVPSKELIAFKEKWLG